MKSSIKTAAVAAGLTLPIAGLSSSVASADFGPAGTSGHAVTAVTAQRFSIDVNHYWNCTGVSGSATVSSSGSDLSFSPTFSGCQWIAAGPHPATITTAGSWTYSGGNTTGTLQLGAALVIRSGGCVISFSPGSWTMAFSNIGANSQVQSTAASIPYTSTGCAPFGIAASGHTASYVGTLTVGGVNAV